ncbi:Protein NRT1/ PTR FAMILY 4.3 like, partial [Actinidia chinensis var. chinensis]
ERDEGIIEGKVDWKGRTARRDKHGGMKIALLSLTTFGFENMATLALSTNLVTYLTRVMHFNVADAANQITNYMGTSFILSILVAFLADTCIGRPKAVLISACFEIVGLGLLAIQAHSSKLKPPPCNLFDPTAHCTRVGGSDGALLFAALYSIALGSGGIKASLPTHGADQFDEKDPKEARQMSSFFNWFLLSGNIGSVVSLTLVVWIQDHKGWDLGFGVSCIAMIVGAMCFITGIPRYRIQVSGSNAMVEIIQVYVAAFRNRKLELPKDPEDLYEINRDKEAETETEFLPHRDVFRFLDKAAIVQTTPTQASKPWKLCRVTQVENAKIILGVLPIFCCTILMTLCQAQLQTFSIQQAVTMDTKLTHSFHIPPASLSIIPIGFLVVLVPIYDRIFVPFARKITGHPTGITPLQRVGFGLLLTSVSMAIAGIVEVKRKQVARDHNMLDAIPVLQPIPISVFYLSFQFFIFGIADLFSYIGLLEFFYSQAPKGIKSISTCFLWCSMALGFFLSTIIVNVVNSATKNITRSRGWLAGNNINRNHLNLFYWLLAMLSMLNFIGYVIVAKRYNYRPQAQRSATTNRVSNEDEKELEDIQVQK